MSKCIKCLLFALTLSVVGLPVVTLPLCLSTRLVCADVSSPSISEDPPQIENQSVTKATVAGRRFRFFWKSAEGGALNGVATLKPDGSIDGIASPNESTWTVDDSGSLLFRHVDGRITTRYLKSRVIEGVLCFEGPFLLRDGIRHFLVEINGMGQVSTTAISPDQASRIQYSNQRFIYLNVDETAEFSLRDGTTRSIQLKSVKAFKDSVIGLVRSADVVVEIDGEQLVLSCAPYVMPAQWKGLRIQADTTSDWMNTLTSSDDRSLLLYYQRPPCDESDGEIFLSAE